MSQSRELTFEVGQQRGRRSDQPEGGGRGADARHLGVGGERAADPVAARRAATASQEAEEVEEPRRRGCADDMVQDDEDEEKQEEDENQEQQEVEDMPVEDPSEGQAGAMAPADDSMLTDDQGSGPAPRKTRARGGRGRPRRRGEGAAARADRRHLRPCRCLGGHGSG